MQPEYALYHGDNLIALGSIEELSRSTGRSERNLKYMTYPCYKRRVLGYGVAFEMIEIELTEDDLLPQE